MADVAVKKSETGAFHVCAKYNLEPFHVFCKIIEFGTILNNQTDPFLFPQLCQYPEKAAHPFLFLFIFL